MERGPLLPKRQVQLGARRPPLARSPPREASLEQMIWERKSDDVVVHVDPVAMELGELQQPLQHDEYDHLGLERVDQLQQVVPPERTSQLTRCGDHRQPPPLEVAPCSSCPGSAGGRRSVAIVSIVWGRSHW